MRVSQGLNRRGLVQAELSKLFTLISVDITGLSDRHAHTAGATGKGGRKPYGIPPRGNVHETEMHWPTRPVHFPFTWQR